MAETWYSSSDIVFIMVMGFAFFFLLAGFLVYFVFMYREKQLIHIEEQKRLTAQYQQAVLESQMEIQEEVLQHVSSEIHDNLGQIASLLKIQLHTFPTPEDPVAQDKLNDSKDLLGKLIKDLKSLSVSLNTDYVAELGLLEALKKEAERINKTGTVNTQVYADDMPQLDHGKEVFLYRMAQEILNNMLKHAEATEIHIRLSYADHVLTAVFEDNGKGFNVDQMFSEGIKNQKSGLRNLKKRCDLIRGKLEITSSLNKGSRFLINLPLQNTPENDQR